MYCSVYVIRSSSSYILIELVKNNIWISSFCVCVQKNKGCTMSWWMHCSWDEFASFYLLPQWYKHVDETCLDEYINRVQHRITITTDTLYFSFLDIWLSNTSNFFLILTKSYFKTISNKSFHCLFKHKKKILV